MKKFNQNLFSPPPSVVKKVTAAMLCMILSGLFLVAGCKKDDKKEDSYPKDIPFTEYVLADDCQWENLAYDDKVMLINSDEELHQYVACINDGYPEINFAKQTLLLAHGMATRVLVYANCNCLQQFSKQSYKMEVDLFQGLATVMSPWQVAIIVNKLKDGCVIELITIDKDIEL